jgi:ADP-heptose:LPS heptosyltransferase
MTGYYFTIGGITCSTRDINRMANDKKTGRWKRAAFRLLGPARGRKILANAVRKQTAGLPAFSFPLDVATIKNVLVVLPPGKLQVLHQLGNIFELISFFKQATLTLLAETTCAPLAGLLAGVTIVEYPLDSKKLFSADFNDFNIRFSGMFDVCCLLTPTEDLPLLYCAGRTAAPVRIGYAGAGGEPFLNLHVNPLPSRVLASDWNSALAEVLGAKKLRAMKWLIAKETVAEIDHLLKEYHFDAKARPVGVDALFFRRAFGVVWADSCMDALAPLINNHGYLFAEATSDQAEITWLGRFNLPVVANLSIPQTAALAARSGLIVTGNSLLFGLAALLSAPAVGVFGKKERDENCPPLPTVKGITYEKKPDAGTIEEIKRAMGELVGGIGDR